jgi:hypothetical protein
MRVAQKRTIEDTSRHIGSLLATIEAAECNNCFPTPDLLPSSHETR